MARSTVEGRIKILTSVNLRRCFSEKLDELSVSRRVSHAVFQHVGHTNGIFHCPAFRGVVQGKDCRPAGYAGKTALMKPSARCHNQSQAFMPISDARHCLFYINQLVDGKLHTVGRRTADLKPAEDDNFFL